MNNEKEIIDVNNQNSLMPALLNSPHTSKYKLPSNLMLSNYSCCYQKVRSMVDLKPNSYTNYYFNNYGNTDDIQSLKKHFAHTIPPEKNLLEFFNDEKSTKQTMKEVKKKVNSIIKKLDKFLY